MRGPNVRKVEYMLKIRKMYIPSKASWGLPLLMYATRGGVEGGGGVNTNAYTGWSNDG